MGARGGPNNSKKGSSPMTDKDAIITRLKEQKKLLQRRLDDALEQLGEERNNATEQSRRRVWDKIQRQQFVEV
jgi:uncharacterized iron-regulated protein